MRSAYVASLRIRAGRSSGESGHHDSSRWECQGIRSRAAQEDARALDDDAQREMQRAAGTDERAGQLEVGARVDEEPGVLLAETELSELVETPADHALILLGQLVGGVWVLGCGHVSALTTRYPASLCAERKTWLRGRCVERVRVAPLRARR